METFLGSMVTICVVAAVMGLHTKSKQVKKTSPIYKFTVRALSAIIFIAVVTMAIPAALLVANFLQGDRTVSVCVCRGIFFALGLFLLIQTIPGANDILVDRDDITVRLAWFYKRHWSFSQIDYATAHHNGLHVFVKDRKRRAFVVMAPLSVGTARDFWRARPGSHPGLALPTISGLPMTRASRSTPRETALRPDLSPSTLSVAHLPCRWRGTSRRRRFLPRRGARGTFSGLIPSPLASPAAPVPRTCRGTSRGGRPTSRNTSRGISRAPPPSPLWRLTADMPQSPGLYSSPSPCSPLPSFSLPARLSASRKIHSTCAFALRMSSSAQRSTAAQIFGSMRRGYCLRRATNVCSCEC